MPDINFRLSLFKKKKRFDRSPMLVSLMDDYGAVAVFTWLFPIMLTTSYAHDVNVHGTIRQKTHVRHLITPA